jgi:hypothetical protein
MTSRRAAVVLLVLLAAGGCGGAETPSATTPSKASTSPSATASQLSAGDLAACAAYVRAQEGAERALRDVTTDPSPTAGPDLVTVANQLAADAASATSHRVSAPVTQTVAALKGVALQIDSGRTSEAQLTPSATQLRDASALVVSGCSYGDPLTQYWTIAAFPLAP